MPKPRARSPRCRHPLTAALRRALPPGREAVAASFLDLLDDRLLALAALATEKPLPGRGLRLTPADRALARRFLADHEGAWDDGDENLVRGYLDRWTRRGENPVAATARGLSEAALALGGMRARPETLWFFLWELESVLSAVADNPGRPC